MPAKRMSTTHLLQISITHTNTKSGNITFRTGTASTPTSISMVMVKGHNATRMSMEKAIMSQQTCIMSQTNTASIRTITVMEKEHTSSATPTNMPKGTINTTSIPDVVKNAIMNRTEAAVPTITTEQAIQQVINHMSMAIKAVAKKKHMNHTKVAVLNTTMVPLKKSQKKSTATRDAAKEKSTNLIRAVVKNTITARS